MATNLRYLGLFPHLTTGVHGDPMVQTAVINAVNRMMSVADAKKITYGFRRSRTSMISLIEDYQRGNLPDFDVIKDDLYYQCIDLVKDRFAPQNTYRPVHFVDLRHYPYPLNSSAEAPYTSDKELRSKVVRLYNDGKLLSPRLTFHNLYNYIFDKERHVIHRIKDGLMTDHRGRSVLLWNTAHARAHLVCAEDEDKTRMVYGVPKRLIFIETMFLWPLMRDLLDYDGPMLWGYETLKGGWYKLYNYFTTYQPRAQTYLAIDWKQFDKRARFTVIDDLHYKVIRKYLNFNDGYIPTINYPGSHTEPHRLENLFDYMNYAIKWTPDLLPDGKMFRRRFAGVASGYFQTQILGSMYNLLMLFVILAEQGINVNNISVKVQGDDSIIAINEYIPPHMHEKFLKDLADCAMRRFNAVINTTKTKMSNSLDGLPVLGYTNKHAHPVRGKHELLASLAYPERQCDPSRLMARCIGMAWANCGNYREVFNVSKDVYEYFKRKGYSPNMAGLPDLVKSQFEVGKSTSTDFFIRKDFPSWFDTQRHLFDISSRSEKETQHLWPDCHFNSRY